MLLLKFCILSHSTDEVFLKSESRLRWTSR